VLVGQPTGLGEERVVDEINAAFAQYGLDENRGRRLGDCRTKLLEVVPVDESDVRKAGTEVETILLLPGDRERAVGAAVIRVSQSDDAVLGVRKALASMRTSQLQSSLDGFRATRGVEDALESGESAEPLGQLAGIAAGVLRGEWTSLPAWSAIAATMRG